MGADEFPESRVCSEILNSSEINLSLPLKKDSDQKQTHILQTLIKPFVLRRTKNEVASELPALTQQMIYCEMSESQQAFYETEKSKVRNLILDNIRQQGMEKSSFMILQSLTKLRQAANHPALISQPLYGGFRKTGCDHRQYPEPDR